MSEVLNTHQIIKRATILAATFALSGCLMTPSGSAEFIVSGRSSSNELFSAALKACQDLDLPINQSVKDAGLIQCGITATQARLAASSFSVNVLINRSGAQIKVRSRSGIAAGSTSNQEAQAFGERYLMALQSNGQAGLKVSKEKFEPSDSTSVQDEEDRPPDRSPVRSTNTDTDRSLILRGQQLLNQQGFNAGTPDGLMGPRTRKAIQEFQSKHDLPTTGVLNSETMKLLQEQGPTNEDITSAPNKSTAPAAPSKPSRSLSDL